MDNNQAPLDLEAIRARWTNHTHMHDLTCSRRPGECRCAPHISNPDVAALIETVEQLQEQRDRLAADAQRWAMIRDTVIRLDAQARPGLPMGDDDIEGLVLQILEHAARKSGRTHSSSALPGGAS
jgi:hypothetical protein